jgi:hypothetical protein
MVPAKQNLKITRGDTEIVNIYIKDEDSNPVDVTGDSFASQIRYNKDDASAAATFVAEVVDGSAGHVRLTLSYTASAVLIEGPAFWDVQRTSGTVRTTFLSGSCTVLGDVTR